MRERLDGLMADMVDDRVTRRFVRLRQFEAGGNSAAAVRLLERLEYLQAIDLPSGVLAEVPPHRVTRLRRQGERYFATACAISPGSALQDLVDTATKLTDAMSVEPIAHVAQGHRRFRHSA